MFPINPGPNIGRKTDMEPLSHKILMITPFDKSQRGNSLTTARIQSGLTARGFHIDRLSLEDHNWEGQMQLALAQSEYSLVHGFHALHFNKVLQLFPQIRSLPIILTTTGTDIHYDLWGAEKALVWDAIQSAQRIVFFNDDFRTGLLAVYPEIPDRLVTIPQGVCLEQGPIKSRQQLGLSTEEFIFLLPSGLRPVKDIHLAVDALSILYQKNPAIRLLIIGPIIDYQYGSQVLSRISKLSWVTYLGEIPHSKMANIFAIGDVVINSSLSEGQPQAALEAMSLGKPCILTAVSGNLNLIKAGVEGFYINDRFEMFTAAERLLENKSLREEMGQNARKLIQARFTVEQEIDAYQRLYCSM